LVLLLLVVLAVLLSLLLGHCGFVAGTSSPPLSAPRLLVLDVVLLST